MHRPADALNAGFLLFLSAVTIVFRAEVRNPGMLLALYGSLLAAQWVVIRLKDRGKVLRWTHDLVFPTVSILLVFDSLEYIVHSINPRDIDPLLIRLDYLILGTYPTVALERFMSPLLTDVLQVAYTSYYFLPIVLGANLISRRDPSFDRVLFYVMLCFYLSYVGYLAAPALGPRFAMNHLQNADLQGWLLAGPVQDILNRLEGVKRDAFPSGHTAITLTVLFLSYRHARRLFPWFLPLVAALIAATVYCRYHYVVDVIAGVLLALITIVLGDWIYGRRTEGKSNRN